MKKITALILCTVLFAFMICGCAPQPEASPPEASESAAKPAETPAPTKTPAPAETPAAEPAVSPEPEPTESEAAQANPLADVLAGGWVLTTIFNGSANTLTSLEDFCEDFGMEAGELRTILGFAGDEVSVEAPDFLGFVPFEFDGETVVYEAEGEKHYLSYVGWDNSKLLMEVFEFAESEDVLFFVYESATDLEAALKRTVGPEQLAGTWEFFSLVADYADGSGSIAADMDTLIEEYEGMELYQDYTFTFGEDGALRYDIDGGGKDLTYEMHGGAVSFEIGDRSYLMSYHPVPDVIYLTVEGATLGEEFSAMYFILERAE